MMLNNMSKTLYDLQVGDEIIITNYYGESLVKVERLTNNYIVVGRSKYRKSDGVLAGAGWWGKETIRVATKDDAERIKAKQIHDKLAKKVSNIPFNYLSTAQLQAILNIAKQTDL